jgi:serine phosphatase RsbU (regulator of sigma subunit)
VRPPPPDRRPSGLWLPLALTAAIVLLDVVEGEPTQYIGVLAAMPLLAAALTGPLLTGLVGTVALGAAFVLGHYQTDATTGVTASTTQPQLIRLAFIAAATVLGMAVARSRMQRADRYRRVASVADAAQRAILRPIPPAVGPVDCASVYLSSTTEASIGGDLIEVLDTPFGVRAIVGDVRGKGMDAVRLAGQVLGSFREVAWTEADLASLVLPLDRAVRRDAGLEDFVTAVVVQLTWDGTLTTVSCGHPAPYLVTPAGEPATGLDVEHSPPLGMLEEPPKPTTVRLAATDRVVLVTDGLLEVRRRRGWLRRTMVFLPAEELLGRHLALGPLEVGLATLVADVRAWTRKRLADDLAVLALQVRPSGPRRDRATPNMIT